MPEYVPCVGVCPGGQQTAGAAEHSGSRLKFGLLCLARDGTQAKAKANAHAVLWQPGASLRNSLELSSGAHTLGRKHRGKGLQRQPESVPL